MFNSHVPAIFQAFSKSKAVKEKHKQYSNLSQSDLQRISSILKKEIEDVDNHLMLLKSESSIWWTLSDKNDSSTAVYYKNYCEVTSLKKKEQKRKAKVEALQGKIKRALKG